MLFPLRFLLVAGLFLFLETSCYPTNSPSAKRLSPLKPRKLSSLAGQTVISGLLVSRQCCGTSDCCDEGSFCCGDIGCCDTDETCCEGGSCCPGSHFCAVADNGNEGCCPVGQDCSGSPEECDTSGYVPCSNEDFCCPPGQTCSRDSNDSPTCITGGGQPQTLTPTTGPLTQYNQPTATRSTQHNQPTGTNGFQNVTIDLSSENEITWSGDWASVGSSCSSSGKGRSHSGNDSSSPSGIMSYSFTGPCVYLSLSGSNVQYSVSIDGEEQNFVFPTTHAQSKSNCTLWSRTDLASGRHNLEIKVYDVSDLRRRGPVDWLFDISQLTITIIASGLLGAGSSNVASWPLVLFSALVCISPYV
ncbi:hypothetical protein MVEN_00676700 [Mycena venus]|uniref:Uncharacterized protein n=1 Tax=Mycena venus TaxID=2733690 RepID=A0A8H7D8Y3_9AGAR|nr:hypothetical protein MVEN_00676700 [Mycena venus]